MMLPSAPPGLGGMVNDPGNKEAGRAMRMIPNSDTKPAICSERVKGSRIRIQHAKQATVGARNVITVASAMGRYCSESRTIREFSSLGLRIHLTEEAIDCSGDQLGRSAQDKNQHTSKETSHPTSHEQGADVFMSKGSVRDLGPVQIHQAEQQRNEHTHRQNLIQIDSQLYFCLQLCTFFLGRAGRTWNGCMLEP